MKTNIIYNERPQKKGGHSRHQSKIKFDPKISCRLCNRALPKSPPGSVVYEEGIIKDGKIIFEGACAEKSLAKIGIRVKVFSSQQIRELLLEKYYSNFQTLNGEDATKKAKEIMDISDEIFDNPVAFFYNPPPDIPDIVFKEKMVK